MCSAHASAQAPGLQLCRVDALGLSIASVICRVNSQHERQTLLRTPEPTCECTAREVCAQSDDLYVQLLMYHLLQEDLPTGEATFSTALSGLEQHLDFINPGKICGRLDSQYIRVKVRTLRSSYAISDRCVQTQRRYGVTGMRTWQVRNRALSSTLVLCHYGSANESLLLLVTDFLAGTPYSS